MQSEISTSEILESIRDFYHGIWEIDLKEMTVLVWKSTFNPELKNQKVNYIDLYMHFGEALIHAPDRQLWMKMMSKESLQNTTKKFQFEVRIRETSGYLQWYRISCSIILNEGKQTTKVMLYSNVIGKLKRNEMIAKVAESEFDYVIFLDVEMDRYILYDNVPDTKFFRPALINERYSVGILQFAKEHCPPDQEEWVLSNMDITYVLDQMEKKGEHFFYFYMKEENNTVSYKKLHYSWYDQRQEILILTRTDVTAAREEAHQKELLQDALDAANLANTAKTEFLSHMSHDIRTPINGILGMVTIAQAHIYEPERIVDCLKKISHSSKHLLGLLNEILDMSKIESGKFSLQEEAFQIQEFIGAIHSIIHPLITRKQHELKIYVGKLEHAFVLGDPMRLQQVLINLLTNAIKYTSPGGNLELRLEEVKTLSHGYGQYVFTVKDNGTGIKKEFISKIFEPFERGDDLEVKKIQGTGLGLAISQNIVQMMGGTIEVASEYGKGSCFRVTVNLKTQQQELLSEDALRNLTVLPVEDTCIPNFIEKRILLVEDHELNLEIAKELIENTQATVEIAKNGFEALQKMIVSSKDYYDMIFMDVQMPVMDGYEATMAIRALNREDAKQIPIVAMTANAFTEDVLRSKNAGMNQHLAKPIDYMQMLKAMKKWMKT